MRPGGDPDGWRKAYVEASAARPERGPVDSAGRFLLAFLPTFGAGHTLAALLLERFL
jgi:hypothetical protein